MDRRSSSEIRSRWAAPALAALSIASGALLVLSPGIAVAVCPLVFCVTDLALAHAFGSPGPTVRVRVVARALASAAWGGAIATIVTTRGTDPTSASVRLPLLAIALAIGTVIGVYGSAGLRATASDGARAPLAEAPLIGLCDVATAAWVFVNAISAHGTELRSRVLILLAVSVAIALRALMVARLAARDPESAGLAAVGFVAWVAVAAIACTLAATQITWSGLGAALVLTVAAGIAESRRRRALVVLLRASLAFVFAAMLGIVTFLAT